MHFYNQTPAWKGRDLIDNPITKTAPSAAGPVGNRGPHFPEVRAWVCHQVGDGERQG